MFHVIIQVDPGVHPIGRPKNGRLSGNVTPHLRHDLQEQHLPDEYALSGTVGARYDVDVVVAGATLQQHKRFPLLHVYRVY